MSKRQSPSNSKRRLYEVASTKGGFFTAGQARALRYTNSKQHDHVRVGNWIQELRGIYHLALYSEPERPDLILWWLWSRDRAGRPKGVYGHQTALSLFELADLSLSKLGIIVPKGSRRRVAPPPALRLHYDEVPEVDIAIAHDVPVTRPLRSLYGLMRTGEVPVATLQQGYREAIRGGMTTPSELDHVRRCPETARSLQQLRRWKAA